MTESIEPGGTVAPEPAEIVTAGFLRRLIGAIIDGLVFALPVLPLYGLIEYPPPWLVAILWGAVVPYGIVMIGRCGWTLGMRAVKVRVTDLSGSPVGYKQAAVRALAYFLPQVAALIVEERGWVLAGGVVTAAWMVGLLWVIIDRQHQAYHDKVAGTFVVCGVRAAAMEGEMPPRVVTSAAGRGLRVAKWTAFVLLCTVSIAPAGAILAVEVAASRAEREIKAILAELKAQGKPIKPIDLAPPPVPDAENAAVVYEEAFEKLQLSKGGETVLSKVVTNWRRGVPLGHEVMPEELDILAAGKGPLGPPSAPPGVSSAPPLAKGQKGMESKGKVPGPIVPEKVGPIEKVGPMEKGARGSPSGWSIVSADPFMKVERQPGEPTDAQVVAAAEKALERNRQALALIHRAAAMEKCRFDIAWSKGVAILYPQFGPLRRSARLLELEAMVLCEQGDADGALRAAMAIMDVASALREMPSSIALVVRVVVSNMGVATTQRVLFDSSPSPRACRALEVRLAGVELTTAAVSALEAERAIGLDLLEVVKGAPNPLTVSLDEIDSLYANRPEPPVARRWWGGFPRFWLSSAELFWLKATGFKIERARLPLFEQDRPLPPEWREIQAQLDRIPAISHLTLATSGLPSLPAPMMIMTTLPHFDVLPTRAAGAQASLGLARIALLLKAHRGERGRYPASLDELERYIGKELPLDPCSGKPFHYRLEGKGFILYSVGADCTDDGGKVAVRSGQEGPIPPLSSREGADIV